MRPARKVCSTNFEKARRPDICSTTTLKSNRDPDYITKKSESMQMSGIYRKFACFRIQNFL